MRYFVRPGSIVRRIWGDADCILLVFAGSAAEFALNRAVEWLFVTGELPADPVGRFFATAAYAQEIAFGDEELAERALGRIRAAHAAVERLRGGSIPAWAHRDVLYMLVDYSERAFRALHRRLEDDEREELWGDFRRIGHGLEIPALPGSYSEWTADRERHMRRDLASSPHTEDLYRSYRRHLGAWRFALLRNLQGALVPERVRRLLRLPGPWLRPSLSAYPVLARLGLRDAMRTALVPAEHLEAVRRLDQPRARACREPAGLRPKPSPM